MISAWSDIHNKGERDVSLHYFYSLTLGSYRTSRAIVARAPNVVEFGVPAAGL